MQNVTFRVGIWQVDTSSGEMTSSTGMIRLEARTIRLLGYMASRAGEVVSIDELLEHVWAGVMVTQDSVYQAIASLRRSLGDDPKQPTYIVTVPRFGYRLIAEVVMPGQDIVVTADDVLPQSSTESLQEQVISPPETASRKLLNKRASMVFAILIAVLGGWLFWVNISGSSGTASITAKAAVQPVAAPHAVAVLPFLDLTDEMNEEPFADGMSEELIGKLSKLPGIAVSPPTSSFYFKNKQVTIAEISKALHVDYVLDGSVRKSGATLRVAARLTRAQDGYIAWSETYDRNWSDKLMIQDDIANEVAKALASSLH